MHERFHLGAEWSAVVFERVFFVQQVARYGGFTGVRYFKKVYVDYSELR